jgi:hypothetical protein
MGDAAETKTLVRANRIDFLQFRNNRACVALARMLQLKRTNNVDGAAVSAIGSAANDPALLKRRQLAKALNASPRSIDNWQKQRKIPFIKISARCVRYHLPSVLRALRKFEIQEAGHRKIPST